MTRRDVERDPWPWPWETPAQRARHIANALLSMLSPQDQADMVVRAHALGQTWLGPQELAFDNDHEVDVATAARLAHVRPSTIRAWQRRGHLKTSRPGRYLVAAVLDAAANRHART